MTEPIYNKPLRGQADLQRPVVDRAKAPADPASTTPVADNTAEAARAAKAPGADEFLSSNVMQKAKAEPAYDKSKVESIKKAIQDGQYPLDSRRIAESFHALEKLIRE